MARFLGGLVLTAAIFAAQAPAAEPPKVAIIIDDLGNALSAGRRAVDLPGKLTYAVLPQTPHARKLAERAHAAGKEVILHLPMQAMRPIPLGPGALTLHMNRAAFRSTLDAALASVPHVVGVNNHMGSLLTRHPGAMQWLMSDLRERDLYFIDSRTTKETVAETVAGENAVAVARRHVFLDADRGVEAVRAEFRRLIKLAKLTGSAIAIGHPYRNTLKVLAQELPALQRQGIALVPASRLTNIKTGKETWHASSSHSPKVAKSSKPSPSSTCCAAQK